LKLRELMLPFSEPLIDQRCTNVDTRDEKSRYVLESKGICRRLPLFESVEEMEASIQKDCRMLIFECNMHKEDHNIFSCGKGKVGRKFFCRFGFPLALVPLTYIHCDGRIKLARNDPWMNKFNRYFLSAVSCVFCGGFTSLRVSS